MITQQLKVWNVLKHWSIFLVHCGFVPPQGQGFLPLSMSVLLSHANLMQQVFQLQMRNNKLETDIQVIM